MKRHQYNKPPILEAFCEFQFSSDMGWDASTPEQIHEQLRQMFPKSRQAGRFEVEISTQNDEVEQRARTTKTMQFLQDDEKMLFQVAPHLLAVNHLAPYTSWHKFLPIIKDCFNAYQAVVKPTSFRRIGLRYINQIEIVSPRIDLEDYFRFYPHTEGEFEDFSAFTAGIFMHYDEIASILKLQLTSTGTQKPHTLVALLDLDYFLNKPESVTMENVFDWIDTAHSRIERTFEASIKDSLRQLFEEVNG